MASRLATSLAIGVGCLIGGSLALLHTPQTPSIEPEAPARPAKLAAARAAAHSVPPASSSVAVSASESAVLAAGTRVTERATRRELGDLTPSPHDRPLTSERELRKAERLCIRDLPDECVRVADAYAAGSLVEVDKKRASQYRNLAFKTYIRMCEANQPEACYALARMYLHGDYVKPNPAYAQNLMKRVVEVCRYRRADICQRLVEEAPMPPKKRRGTKSSSQ